MMLPDALSLRSAASFIFVLLLPFLGYGQVAENCSNGLDDDGDGLIDCFDPECYCAAECESFYFSSCVASCSYVPPCGDPVLGVQWTSEAETGTFSVLVAGDMDADGIPDVVTTLTEGFSIFIIDGATGATKQEITSPTRLPGGTAPAIADLDNDGYGEIVIVGNDRRLRCWNHDGTLAWTSTVLVGYGIRYQYSVPNIADFDFDGNPEVNIGNQVFSGQTGALLASGGPGRSAGEHPARTPNLFSFNMPVAIDALPDGFCADCDGLEIVAGNQVFAVNLTTGAVTTVVAAPVGYSDGYTSVVDFDRDGDLDAIVQGRKFGENTVYCWDVQTNTVLREFRLFNNNADAASRVNVADLNADGELEVNFISYPWIYTLRNNFDTLWTLPTTDLSSITSSSVFDFCGDGSADVIYRGQSALQVLDGATGNVTWEDECISATHIENPLVLDVDSDGQTEIVIQCGSTDNIWGPGNVLVYEAVGSPGIASRRVWNQHAYINTNINDDLSVPRAQQNHHIIGDGLAMNSFLNQYFDPLFPSPDGTMTLQSIQCLGDSMVFEVEICNQGDNFLPRQTPITLYRGNPENLAALPLGLFPLDTLLAPDSCVLFTFTLPRIANDSVFAVINDDSTLPAPYSLEDDFPVTLLGECDFTNNITGFFLSYLPPDLDLGPDTAICNSGTLALNGGGRDYISWQWNDGVQDSSRVITQSGLYALSVTDRCGFLQTDTIMVDIAPDIVADLGVDQVLCAGETTALQQSGFDTYVWSPAILVDCDTCAQVTAAPAASGELIFTGLFDNGCLSSDTVYFTVNDTFNYTVDTVICFGSSVTWNGETLLPGSFRQFAFQTVHGCDSMVAVRVTGTTIGTYQFTIDTSLCAGTFFSVAGIPLLPGEDQVFNLSSIAGCDSVIQVNTTRLDTFATAASVAICFGTQADVFGQPTSIPGVYQRTFAAANGCDSTHTITLAVYDPIEVALQADTTCPNTPTGTLGAVITGSAPPFSLTWAPSGYSGTQLDNLPAGQYALTVTDANDCTETAAAVVEAYPEIEFSVSTDSVQCYGQESGAVIIETVDTTLVFALSNAVFSQQYLYENLGAGLYTVYAQDVYGCSDTVSAEVGEPLELVLQLPGDTVLTLGDSLYIRAFSTGTPPLQYQWTGAGILDCDTCETPLIRPVQHTLYHLLVTDANGCTASDSVFYEVRRIIERYIPNVFKPEGAVFDENAVFQPYTGSAISRIVVFRIFDRWGNMLHEVENAVPNAGGNAWDGRYNGKLAPAGVYVWFMEVDLVDGGREQFRGEVTLIR